MGKAVCHYCDAIFNGDLERLDHNAWNTEISAFVCRPCREKRHTGPQVLTELVPSQIAKDILSIFRGHQPEIEEYLKRSPFDIPFSTDNLEEQLLKLGAIELNTIKTFLWVLIDLRKTEIRKSRTYMKKPSEFIKERAEAFLSEVDCPGLLEGDYQAEIQLELFLSRFGLDLQAHQAEYFRRNKEGS